MGPAAAVRMFVIFEAALPNPNPGLGIEGCRPVSDFWVSLSDLNQFPTAADRAAALATFYYTGLPGFDPVVQHANYGLPLGQIRADLFIVQAGITWQLREFRTGFEAAEPPRCSWCRSEAIPSPSSTTRTSTEARTPTLQA